MQRHDLPQGSPEWHAHRAKSRNASDAPAMLGCSTYMTRSQLLQAMHTGLRPEVSPELQHRFDAGHSIEAAQRPGAEEVIGDELFTVVGSAVVEGIELSASFDGLTMMEDTAYECKTLNDKLREALPEAGCSDTAGRDLPKMYRVQMEQQLMVSGAGRVLFVAATKDGSDVRRCWYHSDPELRREIIAGWKQFDADLAAYVPPGAPAPVVVAQPVRALPAVSVQVAGSITVQDNFKAFEVAVRDFLDHQLIREPKTDQDFADLDLQIKSMKDAEDALESAEAQLLAQVASIDTAKKTKDMLHKLVRDNRLMAEKLLSAEKERRRGEIVATAIKALADHVAHLNSGMPRDYMPAIPADFGGVIKGKRSLASMEEAVGAELARAKASANETALRIQKNLEHLREHASDYKALFHDTGTLVLKAPDDLQAVVAARIAEHKAAEEQRLEAERERIRQEEQAKLQRELQEREAAEARARQANEAPAASQAAAPAEQPAPAPAANVVPLQRPTAPAPQPTLKLGQISERLGFNVTADFLKRLGFEPAATDRSSKLYHEHDFGVMCDSLVAHIRTVQHQQLQAA